MYDSQTLTYLALGDSYTIGEAVAQQDSFPYQLVAQLNSKDRLFEQPKIIAKTGWTTAELQDGIKADDNLSNRYDVVTLLIGVNNQYRGYAIEAYEKEFKVLLDKAIAFAGGNRKRVFVISIPDWGVTAFGKKSGKDTAVIAKEIDAFNAVSKKETLRQGVSYTDITTGSREALTNPALIAEDGLHPSAKMYATWASALSAKIAASL